METPRWMSLFGDAVMTQADKTPFGFQSPASFKFLVRFELALDVHKAKQATLRSSITYASSLLTAFSQKDDS